MTADSSDLRAQTAASMLRWLRKRSRLSQRELAARARFSATYISSLERGVRELPRDTLEALASALQLGEAERTQWLAVAGYSMPLAATARPLTSSGVPQVAELRGREGDLAELRRWIVEDGCRVVAVIGLSGIGKTTLGAALARALQERYDAVCWHSLRHAAAPETVIQHWLVAITGEEQWRSTQELDALLAALLQHVEARRCFLALDDVETVLDRDPAARHIRPWTEACDRLLQAMTAGRQESCLMLLSQEPSEALRRSAIDSSCVRVKWLGGVDHEAGARILTDSGVVGAAPLQQEIIRRSGGHPYVLQLVGGLAHDLFGGDLTRFMDSEYRLPGIMRDLLDARFGRLSPLDAQVVRWLAVLREPATTQTLRALLIPTPDPDQVLDAVYRLRQAGLVEVTAPDRFGLHPLVLDYTTDQLISTAYEEVIGKAFSLLTTHALVTAQADEAVRANQMRELLLPLAERLRSALGQADLEQRLRGALAILRQRPAGGSGYAAANVLHLLLSIGADLRGLDCSRLLMRQADLRDAELRDIDFRGADLSSCAFADTFGGVLSLAWCGKSSQLAASTTNGEISLWDAHRGTHEQTLHLGAGWMWAVASSPDGTLLAGAGDDRTIRLWDVVRGELVMTLDGHRARVRALAFSPEGGLLASADDDGTLRLWDITTGQGRAVEGGQNGKVRALAFSPTGRMLVSAGDDHLIRGWATETGRPSFTLPGHHNRVQALAFNANGSFLASAGDDETITVWKVSTREPVQTLRPRTRLYALAFSPDGTMLAAGGQDGLVRLWDGASGKLLHTLHGHKDRVRTVAYSADGRLLASAGEDQTIRIWQLEPPRVHRLIRARRTGIRSLALSPAGDAAATARHDGSIRIYDLHNGQLRLTLRGFRDAVTSVAYSPDGSVLAGASLDGSVRVYSTKRTDDLRAFLLPHQGAVRVVAFSPDGRLLAAGGADGTIHVWEVTGWRQREPVFQHPSPVRALAFSPDGTILASGCDDAPIHLWDAASGQLIRTLSRHTHRVLTLAFNADGQRVASAGADGRVLLWQVPDGQSCGEYLGHQDWVRTVAFNAEGSLASADDAGTIRVWHASDMSFSLVLPLAHAGRVTSVGFAGDGQTLVSAGLDGVIREWNTRTGDVVRTLTSGLPYEGMRIGGAHGLTAAQLHALRTLGAVE